MNSAIRAYSATAQTGLSGRYLEAAVLSRCANDLQRAVASLPQGHVGLIEALERNRKAWRLIAMEAGAEDTHLPPEIGRNMLKIAIFVFARTAEICETNDVSLLPGLVEPLVTFNRHLAAGLEART
ncbi:MAG: flagellar biosynthesis regulator FlaF [Alsobacter sp.]